MANLDVGHRSQVLDDSEKLQGKYPETAFELHGRQMDTELTMGLSV